MLRHYDIECKTFSFVLSSSSNVYRLSPLIAMHYAQVHKHVQRYISVFYRFGIWHRGEKHTIKQTIIKLFYCIYYPMYSVSCLVGAFKNEKLENSIFLVEITFASAILAINFCYLIWKQKEILILLNRVCDFSIKSDDDHQRMTSKIDRFMKFAVAFVIFTFSFCILAVCGIPLVSSQKSFLVDIAFPLDYKNTEIGFWVAYVFLFTEYIISVICVAFTTMIWYVLYTCSLRTKVLRNDLRTLGRTTKKGKMTERDKHIQYFQDLKSSIDTQKDLNEWSDLLLSSMCGNFLN